jgi:3-deoxy-7-phosphoheptulonate synthase
MKNAKQHCEEIKAILSGEDKRMLLIIGPCSAWPEEAVLEYAQKLKELAARVEDQLKIVMRVYVQKPRTTTGWAGPGTQPDPFAQPNLGQGREYAKNLMQKVSEMGLALADEALYLQNADDFLQMLSWVAVGARSTENQEHRIFASRIDCPVGMKNPTSGSVEIGVNSVIAAQHSHTALVDGQQIQTSGNPFAHLVLRGGINGPNYYTHNLLKARKLLFENEIKNPAIIIDASHDNCRVNGGKYPELQIDVIRAVMQNMEIHPELRTLVKGFMLESFIKTGKQCMKKLTAETVDRGGLSVTDPCLGWEQTQTLVLDLANQLKSHAND